MRILLDILDCRAKGNPSLDSFLTSALDGGAWLASRPGRFAPGKYPVSRWMGDWLVSRVSLDAVAKRNKSLHYPCPELNPCRPTRSLVGECAD